VLDPVGVRESASEWRLDPDAVDHDLAPGTYELSLVTADGMIFPKARWIVVGRSLAERRAAHESILDEAAPPSNVAISIFRSRNALLRDQPPGLNLAWWLLDPATIAHEVEAEAHALRDGRHPYRNRVGSWWAELPVRGDTLPCRIHAPDAVGTGESLPLVIALHGAGGNEHMFHEAYGDGRLVQLADEHGFILVAPLTYVLASDPDVFVALLEILSSLYEIDETRIYVLGHSLGAMTATMLADHHPDRVAAICGIAGSGSLPSTPDHPPVLVCGAELDAILPPETSLRNARAAQKLGRPIAFRVADGCGHVLVVNEVLDDCIAWLLEHALDRPPWNNERPHPD
jgi:predicted esterase